MNDEKMHVYEEKEARAKSGWAPLFITIFLLIAAILLMIYCEVNMEDNSAAMVGFVISLIYVCVGWIPFMGLRVMKPNEALVLTLFGKYIGTLKKEGFFFVNPFCGAVTPKSESGKFVTSFEPNGSLTTIVINRKISLKTMTHSNEMQKINDEHGNPIEIGIMVTWRVVNTAKAVFNVDNFSTFLSTQADSSLRDVARCYPYDSTDNDEKTLRGSSVEISEQLKNLLQQRVEVAGLEIIEARITNLAYAKEIAAAMLQRQQANAIIEARQKIVDGAVGMVEMALNKLSENNVVELDDERKAQMVCNLLVVLCGNKDAQPIVNSGSVY